jgi:uncharacterized MAPEG superfamily protein
MNPLSTELYWLTATTLLTGLLWIPYIVNRLLEQGILKALWDPQGETATRRPWAQRLMNAHQNAVENLVVFAPLVLMIDRVGAVNATTGLAVVIYFFARLGHALVFTLALPVLRVLLFLVGFSCQMVLALTLFGWL